MGFQMCSPLKEQSLLWKSWFAELVRQDLVHSGTHAFV